MIFCGTREGFGEYVFKKAVSYQRSAGCEVRGAGCGCGVWGVWCEVKIIING